MRKKHRLIDPATGYLHQTSVGTYFIPPPTPWTSHIVTAFLCIMACIIAYILQQIVHVWLYQGQFSSGIVGVTVPLTVLLGVILRLIVANEFMLNRLRSINWIKLNSDNVDEYIEMVESIRLVDIFGFSSVFGFLSNLFKHR